MKLGWTTDKLIPLLFSLVKTHDERKSKSWRKSRAEIPLNVKKGTIDEISLQNLYNVE